MATVFDSHFASVGFPALLEQFGESITYLPRSGGARPITAIIDRDPPAVLDVSGNSIFPLANIRVYNSCRSGISSKEIEMLIRIGDTIPKRVSIMQMTAQDSGVTAFSVV
jgi:hypothetical protein